MSDPNWPAWFYGPGGAARIFQSAGEVPEGWADHPDKVKAAPPEPEERPEKRKGGRPKKATDEPAAS